MPTITSRCQQITLRPAPLQVVQDVLQMHGADEERANLLARLSGGRIGWALQALGDEEILATREQLLDVLHDALQGNRIQRFKIAESISNKTRKDKNSLRYLLELWQSYWRDVLLLTENSLIKPSNNDRRTEIEQLANYIQPSDALTALQSTRQAIRTLNTNANTRLLLEILLLDYPGLG